MNRELLERPFDTAQIKQRQGAFGDLLDYVEGSTVIQRLNDALNGDWTFEVIDHHVDEQEVRVLGRLSHAGITKMQFGRSAITRTKGDHAAVSPGDDLKAAATDALKKCATLLGVGLHLYVDTTAKAPTPPAPTQPAASASNGNGRITARQLAAIFAIGRTKGMHNKEIRAFTQAAFSKVPDFLTRQEASSIIQQLQNGDGHV
jgi:hypothetical protein